MDVICINAYPSTRSLVKEEAGLLQNTSKVV